MNNTLNNYRGFSGKPTDDKSIMVLLGRTHSQGFCGFRHTVSEKATSEIKNNMNNPK